MNNEGMNAAAARLLNRIDNGPCEIACGESMIDLNPLGLIDDEYAKRVNRLYGVVLDNDRNDGWSLIIRSDEIDGPMYADCFVTHKHQVAKILAAYGLEVPE